MICNSINLIFYFAKLVCHSALILVVKYKNYYGLESFYLSMDAHDLTSHI
jgi:hypothetical protein